MNVVGLVTARGGSQALPRKNVLPLAGKPLIAWTIEAALGCKGLQNIVVSTDDDEIASVARQWKADVPFRRPSELARDNSPHIDVVLHALDWIEANRRQRPDYVLLLQPTSPLRTAEDIDAAIDLATRENADSVISVCPTHEHPYLMKQIAADGTLTDVVPSGLGYPRRQDLPPVYFVNGAIYLVRCAVLLQEKTFFPKRTFPYEMPPDRSMQIDDAFDLRLVDCVLQSNLDSSRRQPHATRVEEKRQ